MLTMTHPKDVTLATGSPARGKKPVLTPASVLRALLGLGALFGVAAVAGYFLQGPIQQLGEMAVSQFGLEGMGIAVLLIDGIPTPFSYAPVMLLGIEGGLSIQQVFMVSGTASFLAGLVGYGFGRMVGIPPRLDAWLRRRYPEKIDQQLAFLERYGAAGVFLIGALPLPFAAGTWTAGAMKCHFGKVALACLVRFPKTAIILTIITTGFDLGGSA